MNSKTNRAEDDLDDIYPDLSDSQQQPQPTNQRRHSTKSNKQNPNNKSQQIQPAIIAPPSLGGVMFIPPPPPPPPKGFIQDKYNSAQDTSISKNSANGNIQRQRKNCIYIKNIPKTLNKVERLSTFFRTFGNIKNIKCNQEDHSALIRFQKQQDAIKFLNSETKVFNRSFILYDFHQNFEVNPKLIQQRQKDEQMNLKTVEQETIKLRENAQTLIADKYRCLLFLKKQSASQSVMQQVEKQMIKCRTIKSSKTDDEQVNKLLQNFENQYDWTIVLQTVTNTQIDKKKIIQQHHKHGPIGSILIRLVPSGNNQNPDEKIGIVKLRYLGVKSSWLMYEENCEKLNIEVQSKKLQAVFQQWHAKNKANEKIQEQVPAEEALDNKKEMGPSEENDLVEKEEIKHTQS